GRCIADYRGLSRRSLFLHHNWFWHLWIHSPGTASLSGRAQQGVFRGCSLLGICATCRIPCCCRIHGVAVLDQAPALFATSHFLEYSVTAASLVCPGWWPLSGPYF